MRYQVGGINGKGQVWVEYENTTPDEIKSGLSRLGSVKPSFFNMPVKKAVTKTKAVAKSLAPKSTGALKSGIIVSKKERSANKQKIVYQVTMDSRMNDTFVKMSKSGKRAYYPSSINYGFKTRYKNGKYGPTEHVEGRYFMSGSIQAMDGVADRIIMDAIMKKIDKELAKKGAAE